MNPEEQIIELAKLDGWIFWSVPWFGHDGKWHREPYKDSSWRTAEDSKWAGKPTDVRNETKQLPPYRDSRDAIVPVIEKQNITIKVKVVVILLSMLYPSAMFSDTDFISIKALPLLLTANASQLSSALLKAANKWRDNEV